MLSVRGLNVYYGGIHALRDASLEVPEGKIVALIGANGAGKTTLLRAVIGLIPAQGLVEFQGRSILGWPTHRIVQGGLVLVPEGRRVFPALTVLENLRLAAYPRTDRKRVTRDLDRCFQLFPRLKERAWQKAGLLSGGEQQMLAVGRALMSNPRFLMMDEPSLGLAPKIAQDIFRIIQEVNEEGKTILLVEQNARAALELCNYAYVLETGRVALEGGGSEVLNNDGIRKAYLGE